VTTSAPLLTVGDAAARLGVTPRTLKYYEERGLVEPHRSEGRYRLYDANALERFARILRLRNLGFSLHGIAEMLKRPLEATHDGKRRYSESSLRAIHHDLITQANALDLRVAAAEREIREARALKRELQHDIDYLGRRLAGESADTLIAERQAATRRPRAPRA
jgi:MerR family transcriptional regulator, repressor of the yfmOP operon